MDAEDFFDELTNAVHQIDLEKVKNVAGKLKKTKGRVLIFGNGGSASIASHFSIDMVKNTNIECLNFNDASTLTCLSNDFGYENWVSFCVEKYGREGDHAIFISSSGNSANMLNGYACAKERELQTIVLTGFEENNKLKLLDNSNGFHVSSKCYNVVETCHQAILLGIFEEIIKRPL